jgi:hypothetical protein
MSQDADKVKRLVEIKERLEKRVQRLESSLKDSQELLETVNGLLLQKGFKHPEISKDALKPQPPEPEKTVAPEPSPMFENPVCTPESVIPLRAASGELLAILHSTEDSLRVLPAEDKSFNVNIPPFTQFLVERVLMKMQERDAEMARSGGLTADKIFSFNIVREGDTVREIIVKNVDEERLRELKSSIRWTLEKMYEKMQSQN